jgi:hypothetical protein
VDNLILKQKNESHVRKREIISKEKVETWAATATIMKTTCCMITHINA